MNDRIQVFNLEGKFVEVVDEGLELDAGRGADASRGYTQADVDAARDAGLITHLFWSDDATEIAELFGKGILAPLTNDIGQVRAGLRDRGLAD